MTLVAITEGLDRYCPYREIAKGRVPANLSIVYRDLQDQTPLYCSYCYRKTGELFPVRYRYRDGNKPHFFHAEKKSKCQAAGKTGISEKHEVAVQAIAGHLEAQGLVNLSLNSRLITNPGLAWRRPDLAVTYPNQAVECHEVQLSKITSAELESRTKDLLNHGAARVHWYLPKSNFTNENRVWGHYREQVVLWKLWFDPATLNPVWKLDEEINEPSSNKQPAVKAKSVEDIERCSRVSGQGGSPREVYAPTHVVKLPKEDLPPVRPVFKARPLTAKIGKPYDFKDYDFEMNRTPFKLSDRVRYVGSNPNCAAQLNGLELEVHLIDGQAVACRKPDGYLTTWLEAKDLEPISVSAA